MIVRTLVFLIALIAAAEVPAETPTQANVAYLVVYQPGPAWLAGKPLSQQPLGDHGKYMLSLYAKGTLKIAGPFADDSGGAVLLEGVDADAVRKIVADDPAVKSGVFVSSVHPWRLVDWEKRLKDSDPAKYDLKQSKP